MEQKNAALVIGANSAIAGALIERLRGASELDSVIAVSRRLPDPVCSEGVQWLDCDYTEAGIDRVADQLEALKLNFQYVFICNGILHDGGLQPEKRIEQITRQGLQSVFDVNAFVPALWLARLLPVLRNELPCKVAVFSARVGSIGDNHLGGWYSYRASKAALNMLLKSAAVEYARRAKNVKLLAFHPGTTDTPLSAPYQRNVPAGKLFSPGFVADALLEILDTLEPDGTLDFRAWDGQCVPW